MCFERLNRRDMPRTMTGAAEMLNLRRGSCHLHFVRWFISTVNSVNIMSTANMATAESSPFYTSLLPSILTSTFLPHWEDIWSPTRPALCTPPPLPSSLPPSFLSALLLFLHAGRDPLRHSAKNSSDPPLASHLSQRPLETNDAPPCDLLELRDANVKYLSEGMSPSSKQIFWFVSTHGYPRTCCNTVQLSG